MVMPAYPCLVRQDAKKRGDAWSGPDYLASVVPPVLNALVDADARVRYYACEALYNIAKARPTPPVSRKGVLQVCELPRIAHVICLVHHQAFLF